MSGETVNLESNTDATINVRSEPYYFGDLWSEGWQSIAVWIGVAGAVYPLVLCGLMCAFAVLSEGPTADSVSIFLGTVMAVSAGGLVIAVIGFLWSSLVGFFTLPVLYFFVLSLKLRVDVVKLGAFAGGLVGFISVFLVAIQVPFDPNQGSLISSLLILAAGPGLTTILGQFGGAEGGSRAAWRMQARMASRMALAKIGRLRPRDIEANANGGADDGVDTGRARFRIIHLLWISVWLSLLLTLIRLSKIPYEVMLPTLICWVIYQAVMLKTTIRLHKRYDEWRYGRRQCRST